MHDLFTALGLMLVIEGALYALFPEYMKDMVQKVTALPTPTIRMAGLVCALFGFLIVGVLRGF